MTIRLLITMRDMAAAAHLSQVVKAARADDRYEIEVIAQKPASAHLASVGIAHQAVQAPAALLAASPEAAELLTTAREILERLQPHAVLAGLSTPFDGGIDEAVLACANVPTFLLQDFWGEQNRFFGKGADVAFALDDAARKRNADRFNLPSVVVGSARHAAYAALDLPAMRRNMRRTLNVPGASPVIGFFGQALNHLAGYRRTVLAFIQAVAAFGPGVTLIVRTHPRESAAHKAETRAMFDAAGIATITLDDGAVDDILPACDIVCSLFSNCTYDASYQNWFSPEPLSVPVSMLFDPEIAEYYRERVDFEGLPIHVHGLVIPVYRQAHLKAVLADGLRPEARRDIWLRAKAALPDPTAAPGLILDTIATRVSTAR